MEQTTRRIVEQLTKDEVKELKRLVAPHGHLNLISTKCQLHPNVLRIIIRNGYGLDFNIAKIRNAVLGAKVENIMNNPNVAA